MDDIGTTDAGEEVGNMNQNNAPTAGDSAVTADLLGLDPFAAPPPANSPPESSPPDLLNQDPFTSTKSSGEVIDLLGQGVTTNAETNGEVLDLLGQGVTTKGQTDGEVFDLLGQGVATNATTDGVVLDLLGEGVTTKAETDGEVLDLLGQVVTPTKVQTDGEFFDLLSQEVSTDKAQSNDEVLDLFGQGVSPTHPQAEGAVLDLLGSGVISTQLEQGDTTTATTTTTLLDLGDFGGESYTDSGIHVNVIGESSTDPEPALSSSGLLDLGFSPGVTSDTTHDMTRNDLAAELDPFAGHTGVLMEKSPDQLATPELRSTESSVPGTPPGSPHGDSAFGNVTEDLPSFNSSDMVRRIKEKKASMGESRPDEDHHEEGGRNDATGGATAAQGGADSDHEDPDKFPFTPQNSITESNFDKFAEGAGLPSFNSSEMVQKIQNKKASLSSPDELEEEENTIGANEGRSDDPSHYPFTPQNSLQEHKFDSYAKETNLPSFNSSAMVKKIHEKKAELEAMTGNLDDEEEPEVRTNAAADDDLESCPFTPSNSLGEGGRLDDYAKQHNLPSFHSSEMLNKIEAKRTSLSDYQSEDIQQAKKLPFTPPNSFDVGDAFPVAAESSSPGPRTPISPDDLWSKLESSDLFLHSSPEEVYTTELPTATKGNVVAFNIAADMMRETPGTETEGSPEQSAAAVNEHSPPLITAAAGNVISDRIAGGEGERVETGGDESLEPAVHTPEPESQQQQHTEEEACPSLATDAELETPGGGGGTEPASTTHSETSGNVLAYRLAQEMKGSEPPQSETDALAKPETAETEEIEIARGVAHDIIQDALDNYDLVNVESSPVIAPAQGEQLVPDQQEDKLLAAPEVKGQDLSDTESDVTVSGSFTSNEGDAQGPTSPDIVETNYMPGLDPLRQSSGITDKDLATNVDKVIAEEESFEANRRESYPDIDDDKSPSQVEMSNKKLVGFAPPQTTPEVVIVTPSGDDENCSNNNNDAMHARTDVAERVVSKAIGEAVEIVRQEEDYRLPPPAVSSSTGEDSSTGGLLLVTTDAGRPRCVSPAPFTTPDSDRLEAIMATHDDEKLQETDDDPLGVKRPPNEFEDEDEEELKNLADQIPEELRAAMEADYSAGNGGPAQRPNTLDAIQKKKIMPNLDLLNDDDMVDIEVALSEGSSSDGDTEDIVGLSIEGEKTPDDLNTPDALNNSMFEEGELEWSGSTPHTPSDPIPEYSARDEYEENRNWRTVKIGDRQYKIDMKVIEPYKKVLSHGGYYGDGFNAIVVFAACYLPDKRRRDYHYVMDNLFLYVVSTLELLVVEDYMIVYFHGATPRYKMPSLRWLKRCYEMIDRRLRKNLKGLLIVHPTLWLRTIVLMTRPFISSKFYSKLKYVRSLQELTHMVPTEYIYIPDEIKVADQIYQKKYSIPHKKFVNH